MSARHFHFNLGPVQGFVAQARRTRDFWAGSFLLSYLAGVAMQAVRHQGGAIQFPQPPSAFIDTLAHGGRGPRQGGVPNRFTATVPAEFQAQRIVESVNGVWQQLAEHVWRHDGLDTIDTHGRARRAVWDEQIATFWDMSWMLSDGPDHAALDRRKNWRAHYPPAQGGAKCMIMDGWRELSGAPMFPGSARSDFWQALRASSIRGIASDLLAGEQLSAIAYVKRRFARHFSTFSADAGGWTVHGWDVPTGVPSVAFIAAAPWLADVIAQTDAERVRDFHHAVAQLNPEYGEWDSDLRCVSDALAERSGATRRWQALDGSLLFPATYDNAARFPGMESERRRARALLGTLRDATVPSPFYAVLAMDGDRLGKMLAQGKQSDVSQALGDFTAQVPDIVDAHSGFLVYAGGDDVLALLPLEHALACAAALRTGYRQACEQVGLQDAGISAGVHFAHMHTPLGRVLGDAHTLLDDVAKDATGRDAIAVRVSKPGGVSCTWSLPWAAALDHNARVIPQTIADDFASRDAETPFSSKFFYRIREQIEQLNADDASLDHHTKCQLLASRYLTSGINDHRENKLTMAQAEAQIRPLLAICRDVRREDNGELTQGAAIRVDGALLVRFLAAKGLGREDAA